MKKLILALFCFVLSISLVACSSSGDTTGSKSSDTASKNNSSTAITDNSSQNNSVSSIGSDTSETGELKDGTYTAEADNYNDEGYKPFVELTVSDGKVTKIDLDAVNQDGDYKKDSDNDGWIDKIMLFEQEVVAKGLEAIDIATDGAVNGIEGFDLNLGEYRDLINEAIDKAKNKNA